VPGATPFLAEGYWLDRGTIGSRKRCLFDSYRELMMLEKIIVAVIVELSVLIVRKWIRYQFEG
jgi:hypothetical protein